MTRVKKALLVIVGGPVAVVATLLILAAVVAKVDPEGWKQAQEASQVRRAERQAERQAKREAKAEAKEHKSTLSWGMQRNANKVAKDAVAEYAIAKKHGTSIDRCVHAGIVAAAFLQAQNSMEYEKWKATEKVDCQ